MGPMANATSAPSGLQPSTTVMHRLLRCMSPFPLGPPHRHAAARVMAQSQPTEVLVSRVVTDLVAVAGLKFSERGSHELKGLPARWDLFAASV